ncbi:MAG: hypothetical protein ACI31X_06245 [Lactobacillus amylovorus]
MTNYSPDNSRVVAKWRKNKKIYCAFIDNTIVEYGLHKIPKRYAKVDRFYLHEIISRLKSGRMKFNDLNTKEF